jgi:hypothetical protein
MIGVVPTGALTAAGTDGVGEATTVGTALSLALTLSMNATFVFFDGVETVPSVAATTGADITPVTAISRSVVAVGVTWADGGTFSPVRTSLFVLGSTMRKSLDLAPRDAPELSRGCATVGDGATGTCCGCGW